MRFLFFGANKFWNDVLADYMPDRRAFLSFARAYLTQTSGEMLGIEAILEFEL